MLLVFDLLPFSAQHISSVLLRQSHFFLRRSLVWSWSLRKAIARFCVVCRVEQSYQKVMALWHQLHVNTKSLISWNYLRKDLDLVKTWNLEKVIMTALPQAHNLLAGFFSEGTSYCETPPHPIGVKWSQGYCFGVRGLRLLGTRNFCISVWSRGILVN